MQKIKFYGAYAAALSYIIYMANINRKSNKLQGTTLLYRGLQLTKQELECYVPGKKHHLSGYVSTSTDRSVAVKFAIKSEDKNKVPVIFEILFNGK